MSCPTVVQPEYQKQVHDLVGLAGRQQASEKGLRMLYRQAALAGRLLDR